MEVGTGNSGKHGFTNNTLANGHTRLSRFSRSQLRSLKQYRCSVTISGSTKGLAENTKASIIPIIGKARLTIGTLIAQSHGPKSV